MAQDIGMAGAPDAAAQLFAEIVRDAGEVPGVERANAFRYAAAEAAWRGRAGQTAAAAHALTELLSGDLGDCRETDIEEARASLAYWTRDALLQTRRQAPASERTHRPGASAPPPADSSADEG
jgi:hypothetical protein